MNVLFFGDVYGRSGRIVIKENLQSLKEEFAADICIMNCENMASGKGITERTARELFAVGIDLFTSGNHLWDKKESMGYLEQEKRILRPLNYPSGAYGNPWHIIETKSGGKLGVFCLMGQVYTLACDSPWRHAEEIIPVIKMETSAILVDMHAEATGEKRAMGFFLDGKVSAVVGTHTHIQTADEEILPAGTAYITDVGMNGPHDSVIGVKTEIILEKQRTGMPIRFEPAESGNQINAVCIRIDEVSGKALEITRIRRKLD
ncbi:MAG: TIGR00282 family metallophosphoesterase [Candidatus Cloacimonetes bacterium]|nr:TIGR00282 family metallophosphoesterase [Candidatus Cloacimonadota bacterium]